MERNPKEIANYFTMKRFKLASNPEGHDDKEYFDLLTDAIEAYADQQVSIAVEKSLEVASEEAYKCEGFINDGDAIKLEKNILSLKQQIIEQLKQEK